VNTLTAVADPAFAGLTSGGLASWASPACSVEESFDVWPPQFTAVAYDTAASPADFTASDGAAGQPYVLVGGPPASAATQALAPSSGGEVPAGAAVGGGNAAAPGVSQASAGDPVDTENGDFTQSGTDVSIPGFGPSLEFSRTYDAQVAQQETLAGSPGPMGYGWTDNRAASLSAARPVPGDIYTMDGLRTNTGDGGGAGAGPLDAPAGVFVNGSGTYIADALDNRVQEVPAASGTQWGISMTAGDVYTIAGSATAASGSSGDGGPAASALLSDPQGVTVSSAGTLYIADTGNNRVRKVTPAGVISAFAGTGTAGTSGDQGPATSARLNHPTGVTMGAGTSGDVYIADAGNNRIQEVSATAKTQWGWTMTAGDVYTIAGATSGTSGSSGDGGAALSALLSSPQGVAVSSAGDLYIADTGNNRIQETPAANSTQWGQSMTKHFMYTVAGSAAGASGHSGDGGPAGSALLDQPAAVNWGNGGQLYIADTANNRVQEAAGTGHTERGTVMTAGDIYTIAGSATGTAGFSGNGGLATSALLTGPAQAALDGSGNLYITDAGNNRVREVAASSGNITAFAGNGGTLAQDGDGGTATGAGLSFPAGLASDAAGNVYIADLASNRIQEIAASSHAQWGQAMTAGDVYTVAGSATGQPGSSGDGGPAAAALLTGPSAVAADSAGNLFIADANGTVIREIAAASGTQWGIVMTAGDIYTIAGGGTASPGDGGPATAAALGQVLGITASPAGDIYLADAVGNRIQEVAAATGSQWGQAMTARDIYTVAGAAAGTPGTAGDGGPGTAALLSGPSGVALDNAGNLYIADTSNSRIQELAAASGTHWGQAMTARDIYTVAGSATGAHGLSGDGGPATSALLGNPVSVTAYSGVAIDASGNMYIADTANNRIQEVAAANGTQWSQAMTAGYIYTVAGAAAGTRGKTGDGGPATAARLAVPPSVTTDPAGDLFITDAQNNTIREVTATSASPFPAAPAPAGITITQDNGSQVTFYPQTAGSCTAPYVTAGGYCALPQDIGATLTFHSASSTYTYVPSPGTTDTFASAGKLTAETDAAGDTLTIAYNTPAPGAGQCPATATTCETITAASGRALVIGSSASGLVTSVTDPLGRKWTYGYSSSDLTTVTDPMSRVTTYTYGQGSTGNPLLANDLLTMTAPNAQPGGPAAGDSTVNVYNAAGQVISQTDPMGYQTTFSYSGMNPSTGNGVVTVTGPDGSKTVDDYTQGALAAESQWTGTTLTSETDDGPITSASGTSGGTLLNAFTTDGDRNITSYAYDTAGNITTTTAPDGIGTQTAATTQQSTPLNQPSCAGTQEAATPCSSSQQGPAPVAPGGVITPPATAPPNGVTYSLYDTDGNQLYTSSGVYEPGGTTAAYQQTTYDLYKGNSGTLSGTSISCTAVPPSSSLPCATINADGVVTQLAYDAAGDLTSSSTPDGNGTETATTSYGYDGDGEQTSEVAPDGNLTGATTANYTTTTAYDDNGEATTVTQAGGTGATVTPRATVNGYDANGNQTTVQDARGFITTTAYNADDRPDLVTDPGGHQTLTCYDGDGNTAQTVPPVGVAASSLTEASCPSAYPAGYGNRLAADATTSTFDADRNQTATSTPAPAGQTGSETTTSVYDGAGNLIKTTAPPTSNSGSAPNQVTYDTYNSAGQLATQTTGYGTAAASTTSYCYDPDGHTTSVVMPDGNTGGTAACQASSPWAVSSASYPTQAAYQTTSSYDSAGEVVSTTSPATAAAPSGATTTSTYDPAGNMLTSADPDGVTITWTYTPGDQPASKSYSGSSAHSVSYGYDASGGQTSMTDATGSSSYTWNSFGELTSAANGAGQAVGYGYDADGNTTSITYPLPSAATWATSDTMTYGYNKSDVVNSVTDFNGHQISITNNGDSLPLSETLASTGDTIATSYDSTDTPSAITLKNSSTILQSLSYSDAPAGRILTETDTPTSSTSPAAYTYDAQGRVTSMTPGTGSALSYGFDASGNLTTPPTGATGTYDHDSELTASALSGTTTSYAYNADGQRLTAKQGSSTVASGTWNGAAQLTGYANSAAGMTAATYDGNGVRATTTVTPPGGSATAQDFVWDAVGSVPLLLMDSANAYIYGGSTAPVEQVNLDTGTVTYLAADSLGSVRGTVSSAGALTGTAAYDAWGNPQTPGGLTATTPFGFAGAYTDPTGLLYLINRYYDPATGQFLSVDPDVSQTQEPYAYASGNPISTADPTGASDNAYKYPVIGERCVNNPFSWCDMFGHIAVYSYYLLDKITVKFKVDPHWQSADVIWRVTTHNSHDYLSDFHVWAHVLCGGTDDCLDSNHKISGEGNGSFKAQYPWSLRGLKVAIGLKLDATCSLCASGYRHPHAKGRTRWAYCRKYSDMCRFRATS
jgi:RHS repeat-associated protein